MTLRPLARTALWAGGGAYVGVFAGSFLLDAQRALFWMAPWTLVFGLYVVAVWALGRERSSPARVAVPVREDARAPAAIPRAAPPIPLAVALELPDVPSGHPLVMGEHDSIRVLVRVGGPDGEGAAVRLTAQLRDDHARPSVVGEGVAGTDGTVAFSVPAPGLGELLLEAEASHGGARGEGRGSLTIVRYHDEIERLFHEFRAYAHATLGPDSEYDTARELTEKLRATASPRAARALLELARVYELVAYGERDADRGLYLQLVGALLVLERDHADDAASTPGQAVSPRGA